MRCGLVRISNPHGNKSDQTSQPIRTVPPKEICDYAVAIHAFRSGGREHSQQSHSVGGGVKRSSHCSEIERVNRCHDMLPKTSPVATNVTSPLPRVPITGSYLYVAAALS
jgi:hypothetical protein